MLISKDMWPLMHTWKGFPGGSVNKEFVCNAGDAGLIPGLGRWPEGVHVNPLQHSCRENSMNRGTCQATIHRVTKFWTQLKWLSTHKHADIIIMWIFSFFFLNHEQNAYKSGNLSNLTTATLNKDCIWYQVVTVLKPLTVWITRNCRKFLKRLEYQIILPASWETSIQVKKQQLELDRKEWTGSKLGKEYVKTVYCHPAYLTYMKSTSY